LLGTSGRLADRNLEIDLTVSPPSASVGFESSSITHMDKYLLICALCVATLGALTDVRDKKIPNRLTYSGIVAGLAVRVAFLGWEGLWGGLGGMFLAGGIFFVLFLLGAMGGGDVKLVAAVGTWAGIAQVGNILVVSALAGGILAACYVLFDGQVRQTLLNTGELVRHHWTSGFQPHPVLNVREQETIRIPYGLAVAIGTLYCVGNAFWWR
jgi:prepilin peptidase CpaA